MFVFLTVFSTFALAADCAPYRTREGLNLPASSFVQYLLRNNRALYWHTEARDADFAELEADGTLDAVTLIEARGFGPAARGMLRARGIVPVASVELPSGATEKTLFDLMAAPLDAGWDAIALDEFIEGADSAAALAALGRVRRRYPDAAIAAWVQPGAPLEKIAAHADLLLVEVTDGRGGSAHLRESHARSAVQRFDDISKALRKAGPAVPAKSLLTLCAADDYNDADADGDAYVCDNRADVDFYRFLDAMMRAVRWHPELGRGAAVFGRGRARPDTVRFVNSLISHYFIANKADFTLGGGSWNGSVREGGFEQDGAWEFQGQGAGIARYADSDLPPELRSGHGWSGDPAPHADVPHGARALRMQGGSQGCSAATQDLVLEPGVTYAFEAVLAGLRGGERASVWVYDSEHGKAQFQSLLPVTGIPDDRWLPVRFAFTLPHDTTKVRLTLSDCDLNGAQTIYWDQVAVNRLLNPAKEPRIIAAAPLSVKGQGYGFRLQWTPFRNQNSSFAALQYSLDGNQWDNIATLFDDAHYFDWLPEGMPTLPFPAIPPGQTVQFRVKIAFWDDSETAWSEPVRVVMPHYGEERAPVLLSVTRGASADACQSNAPGALLALIPPADPPVNYTVQFSTDNGSKWIGSQGIPGAGVFAALQSAPKGQALVRLRANYKSGPVYSNIIALPAAE